MRFWSPERKKADSRFSRKLIEEKSAVAEGERPVGGGPLGGAPPAVTATD